MSALLETDEETDFGAFATYLRAQDDGDLLDIQAHLDPERYPARVDAVRREALRRRVVPVTVHTAEERTVRGLGLLALLLAGTVALLTLLLTPADVTSPVWLDTAQIPDGTLVSALMRLYLVAVLRALVVGGAHLALAPLLLATLAGWLLLRAHRRTVRADVKRFALAACLALCAAFALAAFPISSLPALFGPPGGEGDFWARLGALLDPFG